MWMPWSQFPGKGVSMNAKGKGKGMWAIMPNPEGEQAQQTCTREDVNPLGGGSVDAIEWQVVARKSKSASDMRPAPWKVKANRWTRQSPVRDASNAVKPHELSVNSVDRNHETTINDVSAHDEHWERIAVKIDSGAIDAVMPPHVAQYYPIVETHMSKPVSYTHLTLPTILRV